MFRFNERLEENRENNRDNELPLIENVMLSDTESAVVENEPEADNNTGAITLAIERLEKKLKELDLRQRRQFGQIMYRMPAQTGSNSLADRLGIRQNGERRQNGGTMNTGGNRRRNQVGRRGTLGLAKTKVHNRIKKL